MTGETKDDVIRRLQEENRRLRELLGRSNAWVINSANRHHPECEKHLEECGKILAGHKEAQS